MRSLVMCALAPALALAACSGAETAEGTGSADKAGSSGSSAGKDLAESDKAFEPGTYRIVVEESPEGGKAETINMVLKADETFEINEGGEARETGIFEIEDVPTGSKACFKESKEAERAMICITAGPRKDDGSWTVTNDENEPATMTRIKE